MTDHNIQLNPGDSITLSVNKSPAQDTRNSAYHDLIPHSSEEPAADALAILKAFRSSFHDSTALLALVWGVGTQLKKYLHFYPSLLLNGEPGVGRTSLMLALNRTIVMNRYSPVDVTPYTMRMRMQNTVYPLAFDGLQTAKRDRIESINNSACKYRNTVIPAPNPRLSEEVKTFAPLFLIGYPITSSVEYSTMLAIDLLMHERWAEVPSYTPEWPMAEWIDFLECIGLERIQEDFDGIKNKCTALKSTDHLIEIVDLDLVMNTSLNQAILLLAWKYVKLFAHTKEKKFPWKMKKAIKRAFQEHIDKVTDIPF